MLLKVDDQWVVVGRLGRPHGVKGYISIISFTEPRENILQYKPWYVFLNHQWQLLKVQDVVVTHKALLAKLLEYQEREEVAALTNIEIAIERNKLPVLDKGEFYWHELIGMTVVNQAQLCLGKVTEVMPTGANDVLVVEGEKRHLIPYLPGNYIIQVDKDQQQIIVDWDMDF